MCLLHAPKMLAAMHTPTVLKSGQIVTEHGVGVGMATYRGAPTIESSAGDYGIASKVLLFPRQRFAIALLCNQDSAVMGGMARVNPDELAYRVADIYLEDVLEPARTASTTALQSKKVTLSDVELSDKTGLYSIGGVNFPVRMTA